MKKPPKKLSALLRLALKDLAWVEKRKDYNVDMGTWHDGLEYAPYGEGKIPAEACSVCFAGSVMAHTLRVERASNVKPYEKIFSREWSNAFYAINETREGEVHEALLHHVGRPAALRWSAKVSEGLIDGVDLDPDLYDRDPQKFRKRMFKIVHQLEKLRL